MSLPPTPPAGANPDRNYTLNFPLAACRSMRDEYEEALACPINVTPMENPQALVPCGHPMDFDAAKLLMRQVPPECPLCKKRVSSHVTNWGMKGLMESVNKTFQKYEWTSAALQQKNDEEAIRLQAQAAVNLQASPSVALHVAGAMPVETPLSYPGAYSDFCLHREWTPLESEEREKCRLEGEDDERRIAFRDKSGRGFISYVRGIGGREGDFRVMVTSAQKEPFERHLRQIGFMRPDSEGKDDRQSERTTIVDGKKAVMGKFIAKTPEQINWVVQMMGARGNKVPTEGFNMFKKYAQRPDNWPAVENENRAEYEAGRQRHLQTRRELARAPKEQQFSGYSDDELKRAVELQRAFEQAKADEELARRLQAGLD